MLIIDKWYCKTHGKYFSSLEFYKNIDSSLIIPVIDNETFGLVVFDRIILTLDLFKQIIYYYLEVFNYEKISRMLYNQWVSRLLNCLTLQSTIFSNNVTPIKDEHIAMLKKNCLLSNDFIDKVVNFWWYSFGLSLLQEQLLDLCTNTGEILRIDHTYYATSSIGITINKQWVY